MDDIINELNEIHNLIAKSSMRIEEYKVISLKLIEVKRVINESKNNHK